MSETPTQKQASRDAPRRGGIGRVWRRLRRALPSHIPIAYKLSFVISILMVTCIGLLASLVVQHQNQILRQQVDELGRTLAHHFARSAAEPLLADDALALDVLTTNLIQDENVLGTAIVSSRGEILTQAGITPFDQADDDTPPDPNRLRGYEWRSRDAGRTSPYDLVAFTSAVRVQDVVAGHVVITLDRTPWEQSLFTANQHIILASLVVVLIGSVLTVALSRRLSQPIYDLIHASEALDEGLYHLRFPERRKDELGNLMSSFNRLAEGLHQKNQVERTLSRYLSPHVAQEILARGTRLGGQRVDATVLFADIVGFTEMSERMDPEAVAQLLNQYFAHIFRATDANHGMIDKYIGDCAMLVFGVPQSDPDHPFNAVTCALMIQRLVALENQARARRQQPPVRLRLGLNSGEMLAGNMGADERMEYTVVGDNVNLASRLSTCAEAGEVLVSESVYAREEVSARVIAEPHEAVKLRGISRPVMTYRILGLKPEYREAFDRQVELLWHQGRLQSA